MVSLASFEPYEVDLQNRASLGWQPRGGKLRPLLADFLQPLSCNLHLKPGLMGILILLGSCIPDDLGFPWLVLPGTACFLG